MLQNETIQGMQPISPLKTVKTNYVECIHIENDKCLSKLIPVESHCNLFGRNHNDCQIAANADDLDNIQLVLRKMGKSWLAIESGKQDMLHVNGLPKRQQRLAYETLNVLQMGNSFLIVKMLERKKLQQGDRSGEKARKGKPKADEYSITYQGNEYPFHQEDVILIGNHPSCQLPLPGEQFAVALVLHSKRIFLCPLMNPEKTNLKVDDILADGLTSVNPNSTITIGDQELSVNFNQGFNTSQSVEPKRKFGKAKMQLWQVKEDGSPGDSVALPEAGKALQVGRSGDVDLLIPAIEISRKHAQLVLHGKLITVYDNGSHNGVFVNGKQIKKQTIRPGDIISFAHYDFLLCYVG